MSTIGVILLVILCLWTGWSTISMLGWRSACLEWQKTSKLWEELNQKTAELNKVLASDLEDVSRTLQEHTEWMKEFQAKLSKENA